MRLSLKRLQAIPTPEILYHYTSADGLCGIVESRAVWASIIHFLNDAEEFQYAISIEQELLKERGSAEASEVLSTFLDWITSANVCAFSLTAEGDLLSQWRAYCPASGG
jgi:hypothetical protein